MTNGERKAHLAKSTQPELAFGNDADDMRSPGKAIDPRVNVSDMTNDALEYSEKRIALASEVGNEVLAKYMRKNKGQSFQELRNAYFAITGQQAAAANTVSRYVGGVYVDRGTNGQQGTTKPSQVITQACHSFQQ